MNVSPRNVISDGQGYQKSTVLAPNGRNRVRQHRVVAERALGRPLPIGTVVHHVDDDGENNANANLVLLQDQREHMALHYRRAVLRAGGDPFADILCDLCRQVHRKEHSYRLRSSRAWRGRECHAAYQRERTRRNRVAINARRRDRRAKQAEKARQEGA